MPARVAQNTNTNTVSRFEEGVESEVVSIENAKYEKESTDGCSQVCRVFVIILSTILLFLLFPFIFCFCIKVILHYQRIVIFRLGKLEGSKGPGLIFINPLITTYRLVDLRTTTYEIHDKDIMTLSAITVTVDAVLFYRILDSRKAVLSVDNVHLSVAELIETVVESVMRGKHLGDILERGDATCEVIHQLMREQSDNWGVFIERFEIKRLEVPDELQKALTAETLASCESYAKMVQLETERKTYAFVNESVKFIDKSPYAYHLLDLITLKDITSGNMKPSVNVSLFSPDLRNYNIAIPDRGYTT